MSEGIFPVQDVPSDVNHIVGVNTTLISRPSLLAGGIVKTVRGGAGIHTDFTQEGKPLHSVGKLTMIADVGPWRVKVGKWTPQTWAPGDVVVASDTLEITAHQLRIGQGPFTLAPANASVPDELPAGLTPTYARGVLTFGANPLDLEIVTIDGKVYTFDITTLDNVNGHVFIGATASDTIDNLFNAIILGPGSGTAYAAATTEHSTVTAGAGAGDTINVRAKLTGTAGNALATTTDVTAGSWATATLLGGLAALNYFIVKVTADLVKLATTRALSHVPTPVDLTDAGVGTNTIDGSLGMVVAPAATITDGGGGFLIPVGKSLTIPVQEFVTVKAEDAGDILTFFWSP